MHDVIACLDSTSQAGNIARGLLYPFLNHAASMFESRYATRDDIDASMRFGCGYPAGPLKMIDEIGASVVADGLRTLHEQSRDPLHIPAPVLAEHATQGTGFYTAASGDAEAREPAMNHDIRRVGVVGTGTMASGIAEVFAKAGYDVTFVGRGEDKVAAVIARITASLDKAVARGKLDEEAKSAVLARLTGGTSREPLAAADLVVEAIAEDLDVKRALFADLDRICRPEAILATTTSSLPIAGCAGATGTPARVVGMHFFNPATVMKLVEVVSADRTDPDVAETVRALCLRVGKHPVSCGDRAGFIVNALLFPYLNDAVKAHESGAGTLEEIDAAMKTCQLPMGPFELLDVVGNDVSLAIQQTLVGTFDHDGWHPAATLEKHVADGNLGRKSGKGFHDYAVK